MKNFVYEVPYLKLLSIFVKVVDASNAEFALFNDEYYSCAHGLALKQFRHLTTIKNLCQPHLDKVTGNLYVDHSSLQALSRTSVEAFLTFAHLYGPEDKKLTRLRFAIWKRCGLMDRQNFVTSDTAFDQQLIDEAKEIATLKTEIESSELFKKNYQPTQQKRLIDGQWMGVNKMPLLAKEAGIHGKYFRNVYKYASAHSHSSYLSVIQVNQAHDLDVQQGLASTNLGLGLMTMTYFLSVFARMSQNANHALHAEPAAKDIFARWHIHANTWDEIYGSK